MSMAHNLTSAKTQRTDMDTSICPAQPTDSGATATDTHPQRTWPC
jgi:hypothetical protein